MRTADTLTDEQISDLAESILITDVDADIAYAATQVALRVGFDQSDDDITAARKVCATAINARAAVSK